MKFQPPSLILFHCNDYTTAETSIVIIDRWYSILVSKRAEARTWIFPQDAQMIDVEFASSAYTIIILFS